MRKTTKRNKKSYLEEYLLGLYDSLKKIITNIDTRIFLYVIYDLLFYVVFFSGSLVASHLFVRQIDKVKNTIQSVGVLTITNLESTVPVLKSFILSILAIFVGFVILVTIDWTVFKGLIWASMLKKRYSLNYFTKFLLLNLCWFFAWSFLVVATALIVRNVKVASLIIIFIGFLFVHLSWLVSALFTRKQLVWDAIRESLNVGIKKFYIFIVPYTFLLIVFFLVSQLLWLVRPLSNTVELFFSVVILVFFAAFARLFLLEILENFLHSTKYKYK